MRVTLVFALMLLAAGLPPAFALVAAPPHPIPQVVAGFAVSPLVSLAVPTSIEFGRGDADGPDLYATTLSGSVMQVSLTWTAAGPVVSGVSTYAAGFSQPLGLDFDGDVLYVADSHDGTESGRPADGRVTRVDPDGTRTVVVDGLPNGRHNTNNLRFAPDGRLVITNGNPNDNGKDPQPDVFPYSGALLSVDVDEVSASPALLRWKNGTQAIPANQIASHPLNADFASKVQVVAHGFRNVYDVAYSPAGVPYTAMNGADDPSSQDALFKVAPGANYSFPKCFNVGLPGATGAGVAVSPNPLFVGASCAGVPPATALLGWHVCATGLDFPTAGAWAFPAAFQDSVYVAECGPFFPEPAQDPSAHNTGHKVVRVRLDANGDAVEVADFLTGLALPTDVRFGPDGAMYVADAGVVLRVAGVPRPTVPVLAAGFTFVSPVVIVPAGSTVEWQGVLLPHTVTTSDDLQDALGGVPNDPDNADGDPDTFDLPLGQGSVAQHTFEDPGVYPYFCALHRQLGMVGAVVVV